MDSKQKAVVLKVLQAAHTHGIAWREGIWSSMSGLPWWKRLVNRFPLWDTPPFHDPMNYFKIEPKKVSYIVDLETLESAMRILSNPVCETCGSTRLAADPAGYYCDAKSWDGAPLLCLDCDQ